MTGTPPPLGKSLLTSVLVSVYVCQRVFINMTPRHQLEPPCIASGSLIMSLQVLANYCLVMAIDKAINTAGTAAARAKKYHCSHWLIFFKLVFFCIIWFLPQVKKKKVKKMTFFSPFHSGEAHCGWEDNELSDLVFAFRNGGVVAIQEQVNQYYQKDRLIWSYCNL